MEVAADSRAAKRLVVWKALPKRASNKLDIGKLPLYDARSTTPVCFEVAAQGSGPSARRSTRRDQMAINRRRRRPLAERAQPKSKEASATPKNSTAPSQPSPPSRGGAPRPSKSPSQHSPPSRGAAPRPSRPSPPTTPRVDRLVGECVLKTFDDADYVGRVVALLPPDPDDRDTRPWYRVVYEDGDAEDLDLEDVVAGVDAAQARRLASKKRARADGRDEPRRRRRPDGRRRSVGLLRRARAVLSLT